MNHERFYSATDKLVNAFIMGTIQHNNACACAVGTLCNGTMDWAMLDNIIRAKCNIKYPEGYSRHQTFLIEQKFEGRHESLIKNYLSGQDLNSSNDPDGFIGLCNVFDYLVSIEDWKQEEQSINLLELCLQ